MLRLAHRSTRRSAMLVLALAALTLPASAQDADRAARLEAARAYVASEAQQTVIEQIVSPDTVATQMRAQFPAMPPETVETVSTIASEELGPLLPALEEAMAEAAADTFTLDEIEAITAFYETDAGRALAAKTGPFMQAAMQRVGPQMQAAQARMAERMGEVLGQ